MCYSNGFGIGHVHRRIVNIREGKDHDPALAENLLHLQTVFFSHFFLYLQVNPLFSTERHSNVGHYQAHWLSFYYQRKARKKEGKERGMDGWIEEREVTHCTHALKTAP